MLHVNLSRCDVKLLLSLSVVHPVLLAVLGDALHSIYSRAQEP
jgi:hypothetical protein